MVSVLLWNVRKPKATCPIHCGKPNLHLPTPMVGILLSVYENITKKGNTKLFAITGVEDAAEIKRFMEYH